MYDLPYLTDIKDKIDKKINEEPDFYDNVRVNGLRKDIIGEDGLTRKIKIKYWVKIEHIYP